MLRWLLGHLKKRPDPDSDREWVIATADTLTASTMKVFAFQFDLAECPPSDIPQHKEFFVAAYVAGFCDVMAQAAGARGGGTLSITLSMRVMAKIFGNTHGEYMWKEIDEAMHIRHANCFKGMLVGAKDANATMQETQSFSFGLVEYLSQ